MRQLAESGQSKSVRCSGGVTSTKSHPSKQSSARLRPTRRAEAQLRVDTHEYADAMRVPEYYASTPRTRTVQSVFSRMKSKCRTRPFESCDSLFAFFHAWLDGGVRMKAPKDPGLSDGWRWELARAFFP